MLNRKDVSELSKLLRKKDKDIKRVDYSKESDNLTIVIEKRKPKFVRRVFYLLVDYGYFEATYIYKEKKITFSRMFEGNGESPAFVKEADDARIPYPRQMENTLKACDLLGAYPCTIIFDYHQKKRNERYVLLRENENTETNGNGRKIPVKGTKKTVPVYLIPESEMLCERPGKAQKKYIKVAFPDSQAHTDDDGVLTDTEGNAFVPIEN